MCRAVESNMNNFSSFYGNLFAILVYYLKVGDVGSGVAVVNCTGGMTIVFFTLFSKLCWIILCKKG